MIKIGIIGAGPTGILLAKVLLSKGLDVTVVESGNFDTESEQINRSKYNFDPDSKMPNGVHRIKGGANYWAGRVSQFPEYVFDNKIYGWPISFTEMEMYYKQLYNLIGIGSTTDTDFISRELGDLLKLIGPNLDVSPYFYCENEFLDKALKEIEENLSSRVLVNSPVVNIRLGSQNQVVATLSDMTCLEFDKVVIAAGTHQTTSLLIRSKKFLSKISNSQTIGHNLMEHFDGYVGVLRIKKGHRKEAEKILDGVYFSKSNNPQRKYGFGIKLSKLQYLTTDQLRADFHLQFEPFQEIYTFGDYYHLIPGKSKLKYIFFKLELIARKFIIIPFRKLVDNIGGVQRYSIYLKGEELANFNSTLDNCSYTHKDLGITEYRHKVSNETAKSIRKGLLDFKYYFEQIKIGKIKYFWWFMNNPGVCYAGPNFHPSGTTAISLDSCKQIVNSDLSLNGYPNIFIASASVFASGSYQNPTATTMALALRVAAKITSDAD
jgi:hypothetical protein